MPALEAVDVGAVDVSFFVQITVTPGTTLKPEHGLTSLGPGTLSRARILLSGRFPLTRDVNCSAYVSPYTSNNYRCITSNVGFTNLRSFACKKIMLRPDESRRASFPQAGIRSNSDFTRLTHGPPMAPNGPRDTTLILGLTKDGQPQPNLLGKKGSTLKPKVTGLQQRTTKHEPSPVILSLAKHRQLRPRPGTTNS